MPICENDHFLSEIKSRTDCRELAAELGVRRRGSGWLCPFHDDHHPSFAVGPRGYRCLSPACAASGDVVTLVQQQRGATFREAVEYLADRAGVALPARRPRLPRAACAARRADPPAPAAPPVPPDAAASGSPAVPWERRVEILTRLCRGARLRAEHPYLARRGISFATAAAAGAACLTQPYETVSRRLRRLFPLADLQAAGLFNARDNLRLFRHRLLWPYWLDGRVLALQARNTDWGGKDDGPKELTIGPRAIPYHADALLVPQDQVYICEGVIDTLSLLEAGLVAVGVPGAANFPVAWVPLFAEARGVVLALDNDDAGRAGAAQIAGHFARAGRAVQALQLPPGVKDINAYLVRVGQGGAA
jgi:DNA primase